RGARAEQRVARDPRVAHQDAERAARVELGEHRRRLGGIRADRERAVAGERDRLGGRSRVCAVVDRDGEAAPAELDRDRASDAARPAGDEREAHAASTRIASASPGSVTWMPSATRAVVDMVRITGPSGPAAG